MKQETFRNFLQNQGVQETYTLTEKELTENVFSAFKKILELPSNSQVKKLKNYEKLLQAISDNIIKTYKNAIQIIFRKYSGELQLNKTPFKLSSEVERLENCLAKTQEAYMLVFRALNLNNLSKAEDKFDSFLKNEYVDFIKEVF